MKTDMWRCKICGELFPNDNSDGLFLHFKEKHPNRDAVDIVDNLIEQIPDNPQMRKLNTLINGICFLLADRVEMDVIEKDGKFYKTNLKGSEEEITMEGILYAINWGDEE